MKDHRWLESQGVIMSILVTLVILIGGLVEIVPLFFIRATVPAIEGVKPYTPLELEGRDIYIREGCYLCHSQMVRPFRDETERYGPYSKAGEFIYDHPFQFGSKRNGPDLQRVGGKYPDSWHYMHMFTRTSSTPPTPSASSRPCKRWACLTQTRRSPMRPKPSTSRPSRSWVASRQPV